MFLGLYLLERAGPNASEETLVLASIALCAIEFGQAGGLCAGLVGVAVVVTLGLTTSQPELTVTGYVSRGVALPFFGWLVGRLVDSRVDQVELRMSHADLLSLDLLGTFSFDGRFEAVNPAWRRTLGWSPGALLGRSFFDLLHPDDHQSTRAKLALLIEGSDAVGFRTRYRAHDGSYRWLEWNARASATEKLIYANARDVTVLKDAEDVLHRHGEDLEQTIRKRTSELDQSRSETLRCLALAAEYRDDDTHQHTERVGQTAMLIARELGISEGTAQILRFAAPLHDIGKLGVSDTILLKPGKLTATEFRLMKRHTQVGAAILAHSSSVVLQMGAQIALSHHERWDGSGYPDGLAAQEIPLAARITAIADVFDAITHERPYQSSRPIDFALAEILHGSGTQFDPATVRAFLKLEHTALLTTEAADGSG
jgi:PAS domain S-box-containing protein